MPPPLVLLSLRIGSPCKLQHLVCRSEIVTYQVRMHDVPSFAGYLNLGRVWASCSRKMDGEGWRTPAPPSGTRPCCEAKEERKPSGEDEKT